MIESGDDEEQQPIVSIQERRAQRARMRRNNSFSPSRGKSGRNLSPIRARSGRDLSPHRNASRREVSPSTRSSSSRHHQVTQLTRADSFSDLASRRDVVKLAPSGATSGGGHAHASLDLSVELIQGQSLAACDTNIFGQDTTSDPYVIVSVIADDQEILVGKTKHQTATLNPTWNATVSKVIPPGTFKSDMYTLQLTLMDYDLIGDDDCMGIIKIPMTVDSISKPKEWHNVPRDSAEKASGRIQVGLETKLNYSMDSFLNKTTKKHRAGGGLEQEEKLAQSDEESTATNGNGVNKLIPMSKLKMAASATMAANKVIGVGASKVLGAGKVVGNTALGAGTVVANTAIGAGSAVASTAATTAKGATNVAAGAAGVVLGADNVKMASDVANNVANTATGAVVGIGSALLGHSKTEEKQEEEMENIYKEEEALELQLTVHKGDGLVAKDSNFIGQKVSSDPYVIVEVWPKGIPPEGKAPKAEPVEFGRSPTIHKNLSPVWNHTFDTCYVPVHQLDMEEAQFRIRILDDDFGLGDDDPMGSIDIYLQPKKHLNIKEKWYHVSATSASRASGRVQLSWQTNQTMHKTVVGQRKVVKEVVAVAVAEESLDQSKPSNNEDEMASSMPARYRGEEDPVLQSALQLSADRGQHRSKSIRGESTTATKRRHRRTTSLPDEKEHRHRSRRGGPDGERSKRPSGTRRVTSSGNKEGEADGERSKRQSSSRRLTSADNKGKPTKSRVHRTTTSPTKASSPGGEGKKPIRRTRSHLPKEGGMGEDGGEAKKSTIRRTKSHLPKGGDDSHRRSHSAGPSAVIRKAASSRRVKDKEESGRAKSKRDLHDSGEVEKKRISKTGLSSSRVTSSRNKDLDASAGSASSRPHDDAIPKDSTSSRRSDGGGGGGASSGEERNKRVSRGGRSSGSRKADLDGSGSQHHSTKHRDEKRLLKKKSSRGEPGRSGKKGTAEVSSRKSETEGAKSADMDGSGSQHHRNKHKDEQRLLKKKSSRGQSSETQGAKVKPSSRSSKAGTNSSKRRSSTKDSPKSRNSNGTSEYSKSLLADCERLRETYMEAKPFQAKPQIQQAAEEEDDVDVDEIFTLIQTKPPTASPDMVH